MSILRFITMSILVLVFSAPLTASAANGAGNGARDFTSYEWTELRRNAEWTPRAGLQVVNLRNEFYLMGGRTPRPPSFPPIPGDSEIWGDVWKSSDRGRTWQQILETDDSSHWPARAYFRALQKGPYIYVLGGQNFKLIPNPGPVGPPFFSESEFFNDVWRSMDGIEWEQVADSAGWSGRAGLSSVVFKDEIYVMAGSFNDDPAVIGGPPIRVYYNDVWKSRDGHRWEQVTDQAPWAPRAGAILVVKNGYIYLLGGEDGFTCLPGSRCPPYFNDVWRTKNGADWELVTEAAEWPSRPGHQAAVIRNTIVLFGGFGLSIDPQNPTAPSNPMDMWVSTDGAYWEQVSDSPWNATSPEDIKYDFAALVASDPMTGPSMFTFGGDRETFDFEDPTNYLNVDNDVWRYSLPSNRSRLHSDVVTLPSSTVLNAAVPNPFRPQTTISFDLAEPAEVSLRVFDVSGRMVRSLAATRLPAASHSFVWDGRDSGGNRLPSGVYFSQLTVGDVRQMKKMVLMK